MECGNTSGYAYLAGSIAEPMTTHHDDWIIPDWDAPLTARALITTRNGGVSSAPYGSMNLGDHVGDQPDAVERNRAILRLSLPAEPKWLRQVHGTRVVDACSSDANPEADASVARVKHCVCAVITADCLPVLFCNDAGTVVAAAHAGWRGLVSGVLERSVQAMGVQPSSIMAYLGPAIGPHAFEVGDEVREAFMAHAMAAQTAFVPHGTGKWLADIYLLARQRLETLGVNRIYGGGFCTHTNAARFFSYRRDGATGRMASLIWLSDET